MIPNEFDAIVIGAGPGGAITAALLSEAGKRVLLLERGHDLAYADIPRDHLRNHRMSIYGHNTGPLIEGNPRVFASTSGETTVVKPHEPKYHNNAACVGGGTRVYGGQAWRFHPVDFGMASAYGVPGGSSLADWPITYKDLEPWYESAEWEIGVAGDSQRSPAEIPRILGYPMPPFPGNSQSRALEAGARALGWPTFTPPLLINSVERHGRAACAQCCHCVGFACPVDAKNGAHNTVIKRALGSENCTLIPEAAALKVEAFHRRKADTVVWIDREGHVHRTMAKTIVVSCGAIESARLLLNSANEYYPAGLGNRYDQVGRNLQGHVYPTVHSLFPEPLQDNLGPGASIATCKFNHHNPDIIGGGMLANDFIEMPLYLWKNALPPDAPRWGLAGKQWMQDNYRRWVEIKGPVQDIPNPESRVTLDPHVRDKFGQPVARLSGTTHPETLRTAEFMQARAVEWAKASGASKVWWRPLTLGLSAGQHQAGTCRMGHNPENSVVDANCKVHEFENLWVVDGSVHVTNGGFNPVLTIMAIAFRAGNHIAANS